MKKLLLVKYGEISLKGLNKSYFMNTLVKNMRFNLKSFADVKVSQIQGRIIVTDIAEEIEDAVIEKLRKVFGIVYITRAYETEATLEAVKDVALMIMQDKKNVTFKVEARRADKSFPLKSPEITRAVGAHVLVNTDTITVDVHNPDIELNVEIRKQAYVYYETITCEAGLPMGTSGRGALLLSGGIDSPVAGYLMAKRGMKIYSIHFHSYPYTSLNAQQKVEDLAKKLVDYNQGMKVYMVSLTKIQEQIIEKCDGTYLTVILRRFMFRCAEKISEKNGLQCLITGESLGQVASQTIESINCTNDVVKLPVLRPLIGTDKNDIVKISRHIDTFETSIQPYEDCCTIFVPKHPQIKPKLENVEKEESKLEVDALVEEAISEIEIMKF